MLTSKLLKAKHFVAGKILKDSNIQGLNQHGVEGKHIAQAFLKTSKGEYTSDEKQLFETLNQFRSELYADHRKISFEEIGSSAEMTIAEVARRAASPEIWVRFFYQLSKTNIVNNVLEIGTNLGVSGQYFIKGLEDKKNTKFITLEGVKGLCEIASSRFDTLSSQDRFEVIHGLYDKTLPEVVKSKTRFDLVFIDGNHQYEATLNYFEMLKDNLADKAMVIFDDIHWSEGMRRAWREICEQKGIVFSINFFKLGMVVFDPKKSDTSSHHHQLFLSV